MFTFRYSLEIDAPPAQVWAILLDFERYNRWNGLQHVSGQAAVGQTVELQYTTEKEKVVKLRRTIRSLEAPRQMTWRYRGPGGPLVMQTDQTYLLEPVPGGKTRFTTSEQMSGILALPMRLFKGRVETGYRNFAALLKQRSEAANQL